MTGPDLRSVAAALVRRGAGILAADESIATISQRFDGHGIESTEESRRQYRELLLGAPGLEEHVSGVIMFAETLRQSSSDGTPFPELLAGRGILPGIKVDTGAKPLAGAPGETITEGLDGLRERVAAYRELGARFAKWRAVITIAEELPTRRAIVANAHALARYAALCHEGGLVPIVEPEVLMKGDHDLEGCDEVTRAVLEEVFVQLHLAEVDLGSIILKPSMISPGAEGPPAEVGPVATATVACLLDRVPASVAGVAFLSGGQPPDTATAHLGAMTRLGPHPWPLTFSFGRALQDDALLAWGGRPDAVEAARAVLLDRVRANGGPRSGQVSTRGSSSRRTGAGHRNRTGTTPGSSPPIGE
ncbi:MAG: class I fructose-bisphosphate aldolase [Acidimicrobiales bacterium]